MSNPQETASPVSAKPSFFGMPPRLMYMSRSLFWGGVLFGAGFGVLLTALLVALEVLKPDRNHWDHWASVMVLAFVLIGQAVAQRAIRAGQPAQQGSTTAKANEPAPAAAPDQGRI